MTCVKIAHDSVMGFWAFKWNHSRLGLLNEIILGYGL